MFLIEKIGYDKLEILLSMYKEKAEWLNKMGQSMWSDKSTDRTHVIKNATYYTPKIILI